MPYDCTVNILTSVSSLIKIGQVIRNTLEWICLMRVTLHRRRGTVYQKSAFHVGERVEYTRRQSTKLINSYS
jgi:hypothetical protein